MLSNSLFDTLNSSGSIGVGERNTVPKKAATRAGSTSAKKSANYSDAPASRKSHEDSQSPLLGIVVLCSIVGILGIGGLIANNSVNTGSGSSYSRDVNSMGSIPYGKARFKSGRNGKTDLIGVTLSSRTNNNRHIVYDARWADGYDSSYVFWANGQVEIFSKDGSGKTERTNARFTKMSNGDCVINAVTNAVTTFPRFTPVVN